MSKHVFVSHASADAALADRLVRLLDDGCELDRSSQVFYSSSRLTGLRSGEYITASLQKKVGEAAIVVALITPTYLSRPMCLAELGAAWGRDTLFPLLLPGMNRE